MKQVISCAAAFCVVAFGAMAAPETFRCEFDSKKAKGWIAKEMFLKVDEDADTAFVADGLTWRAVEGWYDANLARASAKRYNVSWVVKEAKDSKHQIVHTMRYTLSFDRRNGSGFAEMKPQGFANKFRSSGVCKTATKLPKALL